MTDPALQIPEVIQTASINPEPSAEHDVNPPTAASEKQPVVEDDVASEAGSIPSDVVAPHRMIKPVSRRHQLPPLPDLRFEQSYLASLRGADTWGRVAWITIRDQVGNLPVLQVSTGSKRVFKLTQMRSRSSSLLFRAPSGLSLSPAGDSGTATRPSVARHSVAKFGDGGMR